MVNTETTPKQLLNNLKLKIYRKQKNKIDASPRCVLILLYLTRLNTHSNVTQGVFLTILRFNKISKFISN